MTRRVFVALVGTTSIAVVLFAVPLAVILAKIAHDQQVLVLQREAIAAAAHIPDDRRLGDPIVLPNPPAGGQLGFYDPAGALTAGTGPRTADAATQAALAGASADANADDAIVGAVPVTDDLRVIGAVRIAEPDRVVADDVRAGWAVLAILGAAIVAIASLIALVLARRLAAPWQALERRARRLGDGDFTFTDDPVGIDEIDRASRALDETAERLAVLIERERQFSADASHQLRTPLTGVKVILESELARPRDDPTIALRAALQQVESLEATVDALLSAARDDPLQRRPLDLHEVLTTAAARWRNGASRARRELRVAVDADLPEPVASRTAIDHVIDVLVENALEHGADDVVLGAQEVAGGGVRITVTDGGAVIDDPDRLFRRRDQTAAGHGIGLALARTLVVAEGGDLRLTDNEPARTTFEVLLPTPGGDR